MKLKFPNHIGNWNLLETVEMSKFILTLEDGEGEDIFEVEMDIAGKTVKQLLTECIDAYHEEQKETSAYSLKFTPCTEK